MNETNRLLREYAEKGSDGAFRELVERYIDLVYSVAVRRAGGDAHRAEDIVQTVFTDLARKAPDLPPNVQLGGWLHRHCCFVASTVHRTEARRQARERQAMDLLQSGGESSWEELAPALDEAIQELQETDREAIVLRFFEKRDLRAVGAALGTSEDAAQKRVSRALEKLRGILMERGVALSVAGLTSALAANAVAAAPAGWAGRIGAAALEQGATKAGVTGAAAGGIGAMLLGSAGLKVGGLLAAAGLIVGALVWKGKESVEGIEARGMASEMVERNDGAEFKARETKASVAAEPVAVAAVEEEDTNAFRLVVVSKETGEPIAGGRVEYRASLGRNNARNDLVTDGEGACVTSIPRESAVTVEFTTRIDGYADTRLKWWPSRGEVVPASYTLKLEKGVPIGGKVVNESGEPVSGGTVGFNHDEPPEEANRTLSHQFSWIQVETDAEGKWRMTRVADDMIRKLRGSARHPDYVSSEYLTLMQSSRAQEEMRAGTHVFTLREAAMVRGFVVDDSGLAVPNAEVLVGRRGDSNSRKGTTGLDGSFEITGCKPGKSVITAEAEQYSPNSIAAEITVTNTEPYRIVLSRGKILRMLVVNKDGIPVPGANVWLNTMASMRSPEEGPSLVQAEFSRRTGVDGKLFWDQAPDRELMFDITAKGFMRANKVKMRPDGNEHVVKLDPALKISGTVTDAKTGEPVPKFRVIAGWPNRFGGKGEAQPHWSTIERYWLTFTGGKFDYTWEEPVLYGTGEVEFMFKIDAEGYAAFVSRVVNAKEAKVHFDVRLERAESKLITVLRPGGAPAGGTDIVLAGALQSVEVNATGFSRMDGVVRTTDDQGQFKFQPDESVLAVYAANSEGFGQAEPGAMMESGVIQIQAWGRVEGVITKRGKPVAGKSLRLMATSHELMVVRVGGEVVTDAEGKYRFEAVPAGKFRLVTMEVVPGEQGTRSSKNLEIVEVRPGETSVLNYNEAGVDVTLRVQWPEGFQRLPEHKLYAGLHTAGIRPPAELMTNIEALRAWHRRPEVQEMMARAKHYQFVEEGGKLKAGEVQPGTYELQVMVRPDTGAHQGEHHQPMAPLLVGSGQVTVEEGSEVFDVGFIALKPMEQSARTAAH